MCLSDRGIRLELSRQNSKSEGGLLSILPCDLFFPGIALSTIYIYIYI